MKKLTKGVFLSDIHMPDNIPLEPILKFVNDYKPDTIILGGDIIDAKGLHGIDSLPASAFNMDWYKRDIDLLNKFWLKLVLAAPSAKFVYLEGNHEGRYGRLSTKYPKLFKTTFNFVRDAAPFAGDKYKAEKVQWIPYGDYHSYYKLGDCIFTHGTIYPDAHAKKYALQYMPYKVVYGHLHHFQAYTTHRATLGMNPRYAVTAGCLSNLEPEWKKGTAHQWVNGFITFVSDGKTTTPSVHLIEDGRFFIGSKEYK